MDNLVVKSVPAVIDTNYEAVRTQLEAEIAKYDIVVTVDTVKDAKALATKLNKLKGEIASRRKEEVAKASEPVRAFEEKVKSLEAMCEDGRQRILSQVSSFEQVTLRTAQKELAVYLLECYQKQKIDSEYQTVKMDDLVKISALTATGNLTKAAKESVSARVGECAIRQSRVALRLSQLENESHRAGLHAPLTREHVAGIINTESDEQYSGYLADLIARELSRQKETLRIADEAKQQELERQEAVAPDPKPAMQPATSAPVLRQPQQTRHAGPTRAVRVSIELEVDVPPGATLQKIEALLRAKLVQAGIEKSIRSIFATETQKGAA